MKKFLQKTIITISMITAMTLLLAGCGSISDAPESGRMSIVVTGFPEYDWTRELLAGVPEDEYELTMLLADGTDMHSYQPSARDIVKISEADMFVYGGGESDEWVEDVLADANNTDMMQVDLMSVSSALEEEEVEGMQEGREEESDEPAYDEHVWMSIRNADGCCREIARELVVLLPEYEGEITDHCTSYCESLAALDEEFHTAVNEADSRTIICCGRFPFRYLADEYGLSYYAAFPGCSTEANASFETILFLAGKVDELGAKCVIVPDGDKEDLATTVIDNASSQDVEIVRLYSMQNVTLDEAEAGASYIQFMEMNRAALAKALGVN